MMQNRGSRLLAVLVLSALTTTACAPTSQSPEPSNANDPTGSSSSSAQPKATQVLGTVKDSSGSLLTECNARVEGRSQEDGLPTGSDGVFEVYLQPGTHTIHVQCIGQSPDETTQVIEVPESDTFETLIQF